MTPACRSGRFAELRRFSRKAIAVFPLVFLVAAVFLKFETWTVRAQPQDLPDEERQKVEAALPEKPLVAPQKPRRLLIFDRNVNYGGHRSIPTANYAFQRMGEKTGAFATEISRDPAVFDRENLHRFDAVFFNNTVGNLFEDPALRRNLAEFVYGGGGMLGVHGTAVAFMKWPGAIEDWPEFGLMLGARGANHKASDERVTIRIDDLDSPMNKVFAGQPFEYRDEFFRVHEPYSRDRLRVLLSIDTEKTDMKQTPAYGNLLRADNDYALAWVQNYGRGRTFYCTIAHNPSVFWDARMLQFYLGALQFALGDLEVPTLPSGKLTGAARAQERLGWRVGIEPAAFENSSLFGTIETAAKLGLGFVAGSSMERVVPDMPKLLDAGLSATEIEQIRLKLTTAGIRLASYSIKAFPREPSECQRIFKFARKMGAETIVTESMPEALDAIEKLSEEFEMNVAFQCEEVPGRTGLPSWVRIDDLCRGRSKRLGACVDLNSWILSGILIPQESRLGQRLLLVQLGGAGLLLEKPSSSAAPAFSAQTEQFLKRVRGLGLKSVQFSVRCPKVQTTSALETPSTLALFNTVSLELVKGEH